jgi:hypothetical protein
MTKQEATEVFLAGLEHLRRAQPGAGPMTERIAQRKKARELFDSIPRRDFQRIDNDLTDLLLTLT